MNNIFKIEKLGVIIDKTKFINNKNDGNNINGPTLVKVPNFCLNKLGNYYLYFAHHRGKYIRMAYSDNICGPYTIYENGVLSLKNTPGNDHIASPEIIIKDNKFILYYHTIYNIGYNSQSTFVAESYDGLLFVSTNRNISHPYFRYFEYQSNSYGIAMKGHSCQHIYNFINNKFIDNCDILQKTRHCHVKLINNKLFIFYSVVGDCPEHICFSELCKNDNGTFYTLEQKSLVYPELEYEHNNLPPIKSKYGASFEKINQLRDPYVYVEEDNVYILYSICGEQGIAIAKLHILI
jgi:hypothetical protein